MVAARSASCVRRFEVRVLECLRFGLGIVSLQTPQRREPRIFELGRARARARIAVGAALRAKAGAVLAAQRLHWQRQVKLLAEHFVEVDLIVAIHARIEILLGDFTFLPVAEIEARAQALP